MPSLVSNVCHCLCQCISIISNTNACYCLSSMYANTWYQCMPLLGIDTENNSIAAILDSRSIRFRLHHVQIGLDRFLWIAADSSTSSGRCFEIVSGTKLETRIPMKPEQPKTSSGSWRNEMPVVKKWRQIHLCFPLVI